jgi:formate dehydrogenase alpha subunit
VAGLATSFGSGAMTNSIDDVAEAPCIFAIGCNAPEAHPVIGWRVRTAKDRGAILIVADPRRTQFAQWADLHLQLYPGTDIALLNGLMYVIVSEGLHRRDFIAQRTEGFDDMWQVVRNYPPERAASITGVPREQIIQAARMMGKADRVCTMYTLGITEHIVGTHNVFSIANLAMTLGSVGKPGAGVNPLRGQNNVQGSCDMGALPNVFPGYQSVSDGAIRAKFEKAWGASIPPKAGLTVSDMLIQARQGNFKAMYIVGEDPMMTDPNREHVRQALESLDFLVCQDIFMNATSELADVILPAGSFAEKDGTFTNTERRVQLVQRAIPSPGDAKPDWQIICSLGEAIGLRMPYSHPSQIMDEMASLTPTYGGIRHNRLVPDGLQWPCPDESHPGTPVLHREKFTRGLGKFMAVEHEPPAEMPDDEYPLMLSTGRMLFHYNAGAMTRRTPILQREFPRNFLQINPADAQRLGVRRNGKATVTTRRGSLTVDAQVTDSVKEGVVWMPFHFAESPANVLTNDALCPIARTAEYKVCAAKVEPA